MNAITLHRWEQDAQGRLFPCKNGAASFPCGSYLSSENVEQMALAGFEIVCVMFAKARRSSSEWWDRSLHGHGIIFLKTPQGKPVFLHGHGWTEDLPRIPEPES